MGRSNLVSEVRFITTEGAPNPKVLAPNFFISGWTPDSTRVVCYRDWKYALVSREGKQDPKGEFPFDQNLFGIASEWVAYAPSSDSLIWSRVIDRSHRSIETPDRAIAASDGLRAERVVPSPNGRYLAVFAESSETDLRIYDLQLESWRDLGPISIHPDKNWMYIQPDWNPWFADSSHLVFVRGSTIVIAGPDGKTDAEIGVDGRAGIPTPSPDGRTIAFVTFIARQMKARPDLNFWGSTKIWTVPASGFAEPRAVTTESTDEVNDLKWLTNDALVFDRVADEVLFKHARIWKVALPN